MAREATISQEEVNAVADRIRAAGSKPTARAVREALGTGSMATVLRCLQVWQAGQARTPDTPLVFPAGFQKALVDYIGQEIAAAKATLEQDLVTAQQATADLIAENERQTVLLEEQQEYIEAVQGEKAELAGRLSQMSADLTDARKEAEVQRQAAEGARTEIAKLQLRLENVPQLEAEMRRLRESLEVERNARVAAEQAAAVAMAKLEQVDARAQDLHGRLVRAETEAKEALQEASKLRVQAGALQGALDAADRQLVQAKEDVRRAEAAVADMQRESKKKQANAG